MWQCGRWQVGIFLGVSQHAEFIFDTRFDRRCLYMGNPEIALPGECDATVTQRDGNLIVALQPAGRPSRFGRHASQLPVRLAPTTDRRLHYAPQASYLYAALVRAYSIGAFGMAGSERARNGFSAFERARARSSSKGGDYGRHKFLNIRNGF